ncbi:Piso0_001986 [Millerozyma farinosa CBS 7064]|uniref:Piso0_001986 protein n=1 Tax=Pichia sorbitophila (strain ATCC MYA-4447 / BCRC 22081 / CBS 7064 / NBRC 10061 / NRRL Y-12695) TaxID=559304 RepID=G8YM83_PICSO|nr:Piso0_001986 [Millerozyma farinosa CBS 7064]
MSTPQLSTTCRLVCNKAVANKHAGLPHRGTKQKALAAARQRSGVPLLCRPTDTHRRQTALTLHTRNRTLSHADNGAWYAPYC